MATVTPSTIDPVVTHPLDQLRGTIRRYVVVEGLLTAAIFVVGWFILALVFDFGLFKVATWDWVLDAPWWLRAVALIATLGLLAGIITFRIVRRLTKELSYPALALVLERRFPKVLGDRLITAVELADVDTMSRYGYSADMIRQTIAEARERVGQVPVNDVFNWRRLRVMAGIALGLAALVLVVGFVSYAIATRSANLVGFGWRFAHVSGILLERDLFLMNTPWPRRAYLELVQFPGDEMRIGKDAAAPTVRVRAYRWVIADRAAPDGWRPMTWADVTQDLAGVPVPDLPVSALVAATDADVSAPKTWTVDEVESLARDNEATRTKIGEAMGADPYLQLQRVFDALDATAARPSMARRVRRLDVPEKVTLVFTGKTNSGDASLSPEAGNEFSGAVKDLKESVRFVIRAEDFRTAPRTITLVPPPMLTKLTRTEFQPAYLHHTPPQNEGYPALKGLRQRMPEKDLSLTGDRSVFTVPAGTELVLTAATDKPLHSAVMKPKIGVLPGAVPGSADPVPIPLRDTGDGFAVEFKGNHRLTATTEFEFEFADHDGVRSRRQIMIQVVDDAEPSVEVAVDALRKVGKVYLVTPIARIPFNPESVVRDDTGLSKLEYTYSYWTEDSDVVRGLRTGFVTRVFLPPPGPGPLALPGAALPAGYAMNFKQIDRGDDRKAGSAELSRFFDMRRGLKYETRAELDRLLGLPLEEGRPELIKKVELKSPDADYFDLKPLKLAVDAGDIQPRYRMDLNVVATDANYDTGPKVGKNQDPIQLLVVSEGDLLAEISKEEEALASRLDDALAKLTGAKRKFEYVRQKNGTGPMDLLDTVKVRSQDAFQDVGKSRDIVQSVMREYRRITRECQINRVTEATTERFGAFANRLDRLLGENPPPSGEEERRQLASGLLTPRVVFPQVEKLMGDVGDQLLGNRWADSALVSDTEIALFTLEQELLRIRKLLGEKLELEQLTKLLESIIESRERARIQLERWQDDASKRLILKVPEIRPVGQVFLTKGESKKIKHAIDWLQFDKDDVTVKVTTSDPAGVAVPAELKLNFDKNPVDFEYEVKAGSVAGDHTITLTPEVGKPVQVKVTVK